MKASLEFEIDEKEYYGKLFGPIQNHIEFLLKSNCNAKNFKWIPDPDKEETDNDNLDDIASLF
ncbi:MAG: hypothetical protein ACFFG0_51080 [Candidatus Thorarchaeota archaeon]